MFLTGVLAPGAMCVLILGVAHLYRKSAGGLWGGAVALGVSFPISQVLILGVPAWPPVEMRHWFPFLAVGAMASGLVETMCRTRVRLRWCVRVILTFSALRLLLDFKVKNFWTRTESILWLGTLFLLCLAVWTIVDKLSAKTPGPIIPFTLTVISSLSAGVIGVTGSASSLQLAGVLAVGLAAITFFAWLRHEPEYNEGIAPMFLVLSLGPWFEGYFLSETSAVCMLLIGLSPLALSLALFEPVQALKAWQRNALIFSVPCIMCLGSLIIAILTQIPSNPSEYGY